MTNILSIRSLSHRFPEGNWGLKEINLDIQEGDILAIAGANGSGKTLLMKHFIGLVSPTEGAVYFKDQDILQNLSGVRNKVGLVFQNPDHQILSPLVEEEVAFGLRNLKTPEEQIMPKVDHFLKKVGLYHKKGENTHYLSGGEKKRLTIAGILVMDPEVIVLDEPFTGLDWPGVIQVLECLQNLKEEGHTIVIISHDLEKFLNLTNRLVIMNEGQIVFNGSPREGLPQLSKWSIYRPYGEDRPFESLTWQS